MRYKITIEYDGTNLLGWQEQLDGPSVQDYLQQALSCFTPVAETESPIPPLNASSTVPPVNAKRRLGGVYTSPELYKDASTGKRLQKTNKIIVYGAGRTDAGVHATAQVAHFDLKEDLIDWKLREALNARLRDLEAPVCVTNVEKVDETDRKSVV